MFGSKTGGPPSLGLSINTGSANTFGANTSTSQPPPAGGLFGSTTTSQPSTQPTSLFGNTNTTTTQPAQTTSLFGSSQPNQQQQQQTGGGGLFGGTAMAQSKPGGLFGGAPAATTSTGGGLFGNSTAATSQPGQTGGLFGGTSTQQPAPSATSSSHMFGGTHSQQQPGQKPAGSLFGGAAPSNNQSAGGGLFGGAAPSNNQSTGGGLFGGSAAAPSMFGNTGGFASQSQQQQPRPLGSTMGPQVVPGVRIDASQIRSTTRYNDLHEDLQNVIAKIDAHIQACIAQKDEVEAFIPAHEAQLDSIPDDVRFVSRKHAAVDDSLGGDLHAIKALRDQVRADAEDAKLSFSAVENVKLPMQYHQTPNFTSSTSRQTGASSANGDGAAAEDLVGYFSRATDEMDEHIKRLQKTVSEIDSHLGGVEQNISEQASRLQASSGALGGSHDDRYMELYHVLRDFEEGIVQVATVVGGAREGVTELQMNDFRGRGLGSY